MQGTHCLRLCGAVSLCVCVFVLANCQRKTAMPDQGMWRGTVELQEGISVPFRMHLDFSGAKPTGYFLIGAEKTLIPEISRDGDSVTFAFSEYSAEMRGVWNGRQLTGSYVRIRSDGNKTLKFAAFPEDLPRAEPVEGSGFAAPVGNYQVFFQGTDKVDDTTVAKFWGERDTVYGTFIAPDGDYGLLEGTASRKAVQLSRFTGWQAIAIVLEPQGETWSGTFYAASNAKPRPFILKRRADLNIETPPAMRTSMKNPKSEFAFSCVSLSGDTVRQSDDRFKGKALIADIMGTWCHNCLDEAPVLQRLQDRFGGQGLEVVGLSFEITDDPALAKKNLQLYKDRFGLTYPLLFCG